MEYPDILFYIFLQGIMFFNIIVSLVNKLFRKSLSSNIG